MDGINRTINKEYPIIQESTLIDRRGTAGIEFCTDPFKKYAKRMKMGNPWIFVVMDFLKTK